jgi:hypothetical protein
MGKAVKVGIAQIDGAMDTAVSPAHSAQRSAPVGRLPRHTGLLRLRDTGHGGGPYPLLLGGGGDAGHHPTVDEEDGPQAQSTP